jgi:6-phosphogluconolactonase
VTDASWTRREFLAAAIGTLELTRETMSLGGEERLAFVGTYTNDGRSQGIYRLLLNTTTGALRLGGLATATTNPSFLAMHPNGRVLYAVNEVSDFGGQPTGAVSAFAVTRTTGSLRLLNRLASQGTGPCYVSLDRTGHVALVANYGGGSIASFALGADGRLDAARTIVQHEGHGADPERQAAPHAHCVVTDPRNTFVIAADLGVDGVLVYPFDARTGVISTKAGRGAATKPGAGPRHLAFHPNGRFLYAVNELDSTLAVYAYTARGGTLDEVQVTPASPGGTVEKNHPADVHVAASGRFLYASNRGDDTIAVFAIDAATGRLTPVEQVSTDGKSPRAFALDPTGAFLVVANQRSDSLVSFRVDASSGRLTLTGSRVELASPACVRF